MNNFVNFLELDFISNLVQNNNELNDSIKENISNNLSLRKKEINPDQNKNISKKRVNKNLTEKYKKYDRYKNDDIYTDLSEGYIVPSIDNIDNIFKMLFKGDDYKLLETIYKVIIKVLKVSTYNSEQEYKDLSSKILALLFQYIEDIFNYIYKKNDYNNNYNRKIYRRYKPDELVFRDNLFLEILETLINYGANVNIKTAEGKTPLIYACKLLDIHTILFLLKAGANPNITDDEGKTPLMYVVDLYIPSLNNNGRFIFADENQPYYSHPTQQKARYKKFLKFNNIFINYKHDAETIIELLIDAGADPNIVGLNGETAYTIATNRNLANFIRKLNKDYVAGEYSIYGLLNKTQLNRGKLKSFFKNPDIYFENTLKDFPNHNLEHY